MVKLAEKNGSAYYATLDLQEVEMTDELDEEEIAAARRIMAEVAVRKARREKVHPSRKAFQLKTVLMMLGLDEIDDEYLDCEKNARRIQQYQYTKGDS